ncbi:zinc finger family protein [Striga asiatica]|uniref:Zinc finger family protein n=1 Tax=Striga asiatica TaxID=4170 RepID=A0A5A7P6G3_STRAF|nr:zinc finger family protein [Striga asiatica]
MSMRSREQMESGPYPVREGEPDCSYYIRTGLCRFGTTCRFNHPPNRNLAIATARVKGEYPERIGQPECQYYLKTGTCKYGVTCKYHHPKDKAGIAGRVALNVLGYPLRPNETECAYYLKNGICKFGSTCKFHHPQPSNMMVSLRGSAVYPAIHSPTNSQLSYPLSRASFIAGPRWQSPSSYAQLVMPQGMVSVPGWNTYSGQMSSVLSSEFQNPTTGNDQDDGTSPQDETGGVGSQFHSRTVPIGYYAYQGDNIFPERPGEPECQFYMKTGDCKFGAVCKFHHPSERLIPVPDCVLSPIGLPLRPGEPLCVFYSRYGICKFGPSCKFDHPMRVFSYNAAASSSSTDSPAVRHFLASSSSGNVALSFSADGLAEAVSTNNRRLSLSEPTRQKSSGDNNIDSE